MNLNNYANDFRARIIQRRQLLTRKLTKPFAENGSKTEIPLNVQSSGSVSFSEGFGGLYSKPVKPQAQGEQAGLQIQRENMNWFYNAITSDIIQNSDDLQALEDEVAGLINSSPKLLTSNLNWSVGVDGDFTTLEDTIYESAKYVNIGNYSITITLKSGFKFTKSLHFKNMFLSHVVIKSEDDWVLFDATPTANPDFYTQYYSTPMCMSFVCCEAPMISFKLYMSEVITTYYIGFGFLSCFVRFKNAGVKNIYRQILMNSCVASLSNVHFENSINSSLACDNNTNANVWNPTFKNCKGEIFWSVQGSMIYCGGVTFDGIYDNSNANCVSSNTSSNFMIDGNISFLNMDKSYNNCYAFSCTANSILTALAQNTNVGNLIKSNLTPNVYSPIGRLYFF